MRSLVLRAGTVAGVVAVLALPTAAVRASTTSTTPTASSVSSLTSLSSVSSSATTGRIVSGEALAAAVAVPATTTSGSRGPAVHRRPLGTGTPTTGYAEATS